MDLHKTPNPLNRDARNKENENWDTIQQKFNNVVEEVSDAAFQKVIDGSKIDWEQMVDDISDLPTNAETGETRGVKEDNKIYRFNGTDWIPIAEINLNPIAEVDQRLTSQLADTVKDINSLHANKASSSEIKAVENQIENIISHGGDGKKDTELVDSRINPSGSIAPTLKRRLDINDYYELLNFDSIEGTTSTLTFSSDNLQKQTHYLVGTSEIIRQDFYEFNNKYITETRTLYNGYQLIKRYNLETLETETTSTLPVYVKDELNYSSFDDWTVTNGVSVVDNLLEFNRTGVPAGEEYARISTNLKENTHYGFLIDVKSNNLTNGYLQTTHEGIYNIPILFPDEVGSVKIVVKSMETISNNRLGIRFASAVTVGKVILKDIRLFELPNNSQIKAEFDSMSAKQLLNKYKSIRGVI